jgi:hypothetical protein
VGEEEKAERIQKRQREMRREKVVLGVFCVFLVAVVEDGFYDVVGPRKFGGFRVSWGKSATGE